MVTMALSTCGAGELNEGYYRPRTLTSLARQGRVGLGMSVELSLVYHCSSSNARPARLADKVYPFRGADNAMPASTGGTG